MAMSPVGLLQPLPIPDKAWDDITMDFIEVLPLSKQFDTIAAVVDQLRMGVSSNEAPFPTQSDANLFIKGIV